MKPSLHLTFVFLIIVLPRIAAASVGISEVAWMGSSASANHEWIEIYNSGTDSVSVDGWTITDSNTLLITLAGSVSAGTYAVLERTSDESAPGSAFLIYTGALVNTGTTITLRDQGGAIVDQVAGGENWESIGGNNSSKDTAQYSGTAWVTAPPTPGRVNATESTTPPQTDTATTESNTVRSGGGNIVRPTQTKTVTLELSNTTLVLTVDAPEIVYVGQRIPFTVVASGPGDVVLNSLHYEWNFGDMATSSGKYVSHRYQYPGEYVLTVHGAYGRHEQVTRTSLTVLPITLSITSDDQGNIQVNNDSLYEVVLGGYALSGTKTVIFPERTVLLSRATITIPKERLGVSYGGVVTLRDGAGRAVVDNRPRTADVLATEVYDADTVYPETLLPDTPFEASIEKESNFTFGETPMTEPLVVAETLSIAMPATDVGVDEMPPTFTPPLATTDRSFLGLCALLVVAIGALYFGTMESTKSV